MTEQEIKELREALAKMSPYARRTFIQRFLKDDFNADYYGKVILPDD